MKTISVITMASVLGGFVLFNTTVHSEQPESAPAAKLPGADMTVRQSPLFSVHDKNLDGLLSRQEYTELHRQLELRRRSKPKNKYRKFPLIEFEEFDQDRDGFISEDELISRLNKRLRKRKQNRFRQYR